MHRVLGASAFLAIALVMPVQDAGAQDPVGGAILGGAAGAIIGGAVGGGRGAAVGAIIGGATGAAIAAQGQPRPGATAITMTLVISSGPTELGSLFHRDIARLLRSRSPLLLHRRRNTTMNWAIG
jgi:hypothetical protein